MNPNFPENPGPKEAKPIHEAAIRISDNLPVQLLDVADLIRSMAPVYLQGAGNNEELVGMRSHILSTIGFLETLADSFSPVAPLERNGSVYHQKYSASDLLTLIMDADLLRTQQNLKSSLQFAVQYVAPPVLKDALLEVLESQRPVPDESVIRRHRFSLDAAFSLWMQQYLDKAFLPETSKHTPKLFLWSDSSPQGQHNWGMSQIHLFQPESCIGFYETWSTLVSLQRREHERSDATIATASAVSVAYHQDGGFVPRCLGDTQLPLAKLESVDFEEDDGGERLQDGFKGLLSNTDGRLQHCTTDHDNAKHLTTDGQRERHAFSKGDADNPLTTDTTKAIAVAAVEDEAPRACDESRNKSSPVRVSWKTLTPCPSLSSELQSQADKLEHQKAWTGR